MPTAVLPEVFTYICFVVVLLADVDDDGPIFLFISTLFIFHGSLMIFRNTVQGMGYAASTLASSVMEIIGRSAAGLLAVHWGSFLLICVSAPMAWTLACVCCIGLSMYCIRKAAREFAEIA